MEENVLLVLKHHEGNMTLRDLQECFWDTTNDEITKGVWLWLQHNNQDQGTK